MHRRMLFAIAAAGLMLACEDRPPKMHLERSTVYTNEDVVVVFDEPFATSAATRLYWITLQPADAPVTDVTGRVVLERADRVVHFRTFAPGDFEVRLHDGYPKREHHVVARLPVKVEGWPAKTAAK